MTYKQGKDIFEIFGFPPDFVCEESDLMWLTKACPFTGSSCTKYNHDMSIIYGTCSVASNEGNVVICPNRLYAEDYKVLKKVAEDSFGAGLPFYNFQDYIKARKGKAAALNMPQGVVISLGRNSGKEVQVNKQLSMDWVLVHIINAQIISYVGVEVQSIDITGNYRDNWHYHKDFRDKKSPPKYGKPSSCHGYNWANVHKRLIPQLISKGVVYSRSSMVARGLSFILPELVFQRFEKVLGTGFKKPEKITAETLTIYTYELGAFDGKSPRPLELKRRIHVSLEEFSDRFIAGANLPDSRELDSAIAQAIGLNFKE
jgi:hypothetical protein